MVKTPIEWADLSWNTVRGCDEVSSGCAHCYAKTFAERFRGIPGHPYEHGFDFRLVPGKLADPLLESRPQMVFVNSMSDFFHEKAPDDYLQKAAWVMRAADWHIYQVLTKRAVRMRDLLLGKLSAAAQASHIWWGVSVENKKHGLPRIEMLRESAATVKWLSVEPLLEDLGEIDLAGIDWVVVGPGSRPMQREWVESIHAQCHKAVVPFFFKQWGGVNKHITGRLLDGRTYDEMPRIITQPVTDADTRQRRVEVVQGWIAEAQNVEAEK
jgi:protein gp37